YRHAALRGVRVEACGMKAAAAYRIAGTTPPFTRSTAPLVAGRELPWVGRSPGLLNGRIRKSVAVGNFAGGEAAGKPLDTLSGCSVGERFRIYRTAGGALQPVVAHSSGRAEGGLHVTLVNDFPLFGRVPPHAGETIGL